MFIILHLIHFFSIFVPFCPISKILNLFPTNNLHHQLWHDDLPCGVPSIHDVGSSCREDNETQMSDCSNTHMHLLGMKRHCMLKNIWMSLHYMTRCQTSELTSLSWGNLTLKTVNLSNTFMLWVWLVFECWKQANENIYLPTITESLLFVSFRSIKQTSTLVLSWYVSEIQAGWG